MRIISATTGQLFRGGLIQLKPPPRPRPSLSHLVQEHNMGLWKPIICLPSSSGWIHLFNGSLLSSLKSQPSYTSDHRRQKLSLASCQLPAVRWVTGRHPGSFLPSPAIPSTRAMACLPVWEVDCQALPGTAMPTFKWKNSQMIAPIFTSSHTNHQVVF